MCLELKRRLLAGHFNDYQQKYLQGGIRKGQHFHFFDEKALFAIRCSLMYNGNHGQ